MVPPYNDIRSTLNNPRTTDVSVWKLCRLLIARKRELLVFKCDLIVGANRREFYLVNWGDIRDPSLYSLYREYFTLPPLMDNVNADRRSFNDYIYSDLVKTVVVTRLKLTCIFNVGTTRTHIQQGNSAFLGLHVIWQHNTSTTPDTSIQLGSWCC